MNTFNTARITDAFFYDKNANVIMRFPEIRNVQTNIEMSVNSPTIWNVSFTGYETPIVKEIEKQIKDISDDELIEVLGEVNE